MFNVYRKEMRAYLVSPIPYVLMFIFAAFMAWWFFIPQRFFMLRRATMDGFFGIMPWVFVVLLPAISMRLWAEEARSGTLETLMTAPIRSWQVVTGKFLSAWTLLFLCLLGTLPIPITVAILGDLDWGPTIGGYIGAMLLGGALLAMGVWISAMTAHQIVAFLLTAVAAFFLVILNHIAQDVGGGLGAVFERLSVAARFDGMGRGVLDFRDLLYFASFMGLFLYLNVLTVENRRYR